MNSRLEGVREAEHLGYVHSQEFAARLNFLFLTTSREGRSMRSSDLVCELADREVRCSGPYISQLRNGVRVNPSKEIVDAICSVFGVHSDFFSRSSADSADSLKVLESDGSLGNDFELVQNLQDPLLQNIARDVIYLNHSEKLLISDLVAKLRQGYQNECTTT